MTFFVWVERGATLTRYLKDLQFMWMKVLTEPVEKRPFVVCCGEQIGLAVLRTLLFRRIQS